jgi:RNA-dependent RNA polymerase
MRLAALCNLAVDYAKNGVPVDIYNNLPKPLLKFKPDWHKTEVTGSRELDYYESDRALGYLFRNIEIQDLNEPIEGFPITFSGEVAPLEDAISRALTPLVQGTLNTGTEPPGAENKQVEELHAHYVHEMQYICMTHTLVDTPDVRLTEEEVVLGTILGNCAQSRWCTERSRRMRFHAEEFVQDIYTQIVPDQGPLTEDKLRTGLSKAWAAWG